LDFTDIRHLYEPMPFFGGEGGYRQDDDVEAGGGFSRFGFNQLLATGAQVGADISLGWLDVTSGGLSSGFASVVSAVISQPLLRGSQRKIVLENLTQAERNILYQVRSFNRFRKEFVTQIATDYQRTLELYERQQNLNEYYFQLSSLCYALKKRAAAGRNSIHEFEEAEQDRLIALADAQIAERLYAEALDAFKVQLSIRPDVDVTLDVSELRNYQQIPPVDFTLAEEEAINIALNQRLDLANAADQVDDAERKVDVAADAIRAELNLIGYTERQLPDRTVFGANPGELEETRNRYQLSVQLDLPMDRLFEKNNYRRSLIDLMLLQRNHQELTDTVVREVRESYRAMKEAHRRYTIEQENLKLAQDRTLHTLSLAEYKRASVRDVLDAQEDLVDAKNAVTFAIVDYFEASLNFLRDTGTMKIHEDGTWQTPDSFLVQSN
jgi:outer membrane protein TolC